MGMFGKRKIELSAELLADLDKYLKDNLEEELSVDACMSDTAVCSSVCLDEEPAKQTASGFFSMKQLMDASVSSEETEEDELFSQPQSSRVVEATALPKMAERPFGGGRKAGKYSKPINEESARAPLAARPRRSLEDVIGNLEKSFMEMVFSFADERGISDLELRKKAEIDKRTFSKLKCGTTKTPSKNTALALAIALELNLDETRDLLARAGMALSPCSKSDLIVQYFIEHEAYDIYVINDALDKHGEAPLGSIA